MSMDLMDAIEKEKQAINLLTDFLESNKETLAYIARWGDGECGYIAETAKKILQGDEAPASKKAFRKAQISGELRVMVYERDKYRCKHCGTHLSLSLDHIIPESKGGESTFENLQTLCRPCNSKKGTKVPQAGSV